MTTSSNKRMWIGLAAGGVLVAGSLGYLVKRQHGIIDEKTQAVESLRAQIDDARATIRTTPELEREVIVLREISDRIREVLPDSKDLNNLIRDFQDYSKETGVRPSAFKPMDNRGARGRAKTAFEKVSYTLTLEGDIFQFLDFLNKIETHRRFMSVPSYKLTAASRQSIEDDGVANHRIQMDVETYKFVPRGTEAQEVKIDGYERKRDLLAGEISRRRQALTLQTYRYRGPRGRRDPFVDPRVPAVVDDPDAWTVQRQMEEVEALVLRMEECETYWTAVENAESVLDRMVQRSELEKVVALLEEDLRRIDGDKKINYKPAERRLELNVVEPLEDLRMRLESSKAIAGPSQAEMSQVGDAMARHILAGEYSMALDAYGALADSLDLIEDDPPREELAEWLRQLAFDATVLRDFEGIELEIGGYAIIEDNPPVVIINGRSRTIGDLVEGELVIDAIRPNEVDFVFRGVILTRQY